jgi:pimeloyl-ACP methyl ester carboxylesterase
LESTSSSTIAGNRIAEYRRGRPGADAALMFVHGNSSSTRTFERQFSAFGDVEVLGFDLPGHGASGNAQFPDSYSLKFYSEILKHLVQTLQANRVLLIGWSLGGHVILEAINELEGRAEAVLVGAPPLRSIADFAEAFLPSPALGLIQKSSVSTEEADLWARSCTRSGVDYPDWLRTDFERTDPAARIGLIKSLSVGAFKDEWNEVQAAKSPVTLVVGADDPFINRGFLGKLSLLRNVNAQRVELIPGAGHMAHWDAPERFNEIVANRIQDL